MFFLFSSDIFITLRCVAFAYVSQTTYTTFYQDICDHFRKQYPCGVLWDPSVGEAGDVARNIFYQDSGSRGPSSGSTRRFRFVRGRCAPPVQVGSELTCYRVW